MRRDINPCPLQNPDQGRFIIHYYLFFIKRQALDIMVDFEHNTSMP